MPQYSTWQRLEFARRPKNGGEGEEGGGQRKLAKELGEGLDHRCASCSIGLTTNCLV